MRRIVAFALAVAPVLAGAGWISKSGESLPDSESRKAKGDFGAHMILVADDTKMFQVWATPSQTVNVATVESVAVNGQVNAFVVFSGCTASKSGHCDVDVRFRVYQPNGKVYASTPAMEVWRGKPRPPGRSLELSVEYLKIVIEPQDLPGQYIVSSMVRDNVSGVVLELSTSFVAVKP